MILVTMCIEYSFMLLLVLRKDSQNHLLVILWCRLFSASRKILTKVNEYPGSICRNLCNTTTYLIKASVYLDIHISIILVRKSILFLS